MTLTIFQRKIVELFTIFLQVNFVNLNYFQSLQINENSKFYRYRQSTGNHFHVGGQLTAFPRLQLKKTIYKPEYAWRLL